MTGAPTPVTVADALRQARAQGIDKLDAQLLLSHLLAQPRTWLLTHDDAALDASQLARWQTLVAQRADTVPLAYLTGWHEFHGLRLQVSPAVLDPRPDTETLVDWALECLSACGCAAPRVLDLGTGSGAVALALQHGCPAAAVTAVDLSADALAVARANGQRLGLAVDWRQGSWFDPLPPGERFDLIASNPPYIAEGDAHLPALRHEPALALTSGVDGLDAIRHLVAHAPDHLAPGGWLLLEHGHDQGDAVAALLRQRGFTDVQARHDLAGHGRCTGGQWPAATAGGIHQPRADSGDAL
jgi:release factor glutamine methyltransferase